MNVVMMANQGGGNVVMRDYRKGNWTLQETMVLIEAKRMDDERRLRRQAGGENSAERSGKPTELRWKWVEDYCWRNDCLRSQNQCNDKWDNLMRDFKKVREYEKRLAAAAEQQKDGSSAERKDEKSYWRLEKNERKANNLPSNMLPQIYEALVEVVDRKGQRSYLGGASSSSNPKVVVSSSSLSADPSLLLPPIQQHCPNISTPVPVTVLPLPPPVAQTVPVLQQQQEHSTIPFSHQLPTVDSDTSEHSADSPAKRRRRGGDEGTSTAAGGGRGNNNSSQQGETVEGAISRSASPIAEAIQSGEEERKKAQRADEAA
ncbi:OLC1v1025245C1 [Oldenlandia corymbosa var. corymbosa]|uniref:OLC1v1025245C1 n=1 Tax=Oldenlandia corymbosa var. corymbosa TaxID=529605 RepID=A0AAV1C5Q3_OLDCO|nr:OLC1v1025245C1 [Oldenlandia corymbosa var. corymbosa]